MKTIAEVRKQYEKGLTPLVVIPQENHSNILVVLKDKRGTYHCHRYFPLYAKSEQEPTWELSIDGQRVPLEAVWSWLNNPTALATSPDDYREPISAETMVAPNNVAWYNR